MDKKYYERDRGFLKELSQRSQDDVWESVLVELTFWENCSTKDCDYLPLLSDTLIESGFHGMQSRLDQWLSESFVAERLEVAGWFLFSYWLKTRDPILPSLVDKMVDGIQRFSTCDNTLHAILFSLVSTVQRRGPVSQELLTRVREVLVDVRARSQELQLEPGITSRIDIAFSK